MFRVTIVLIDETLWIEKLFGTELLGNLHPGLVHYIRLCWN